MKSSVCHYFLCFLLHQGIFARTGPWYQNSPRWYRGPKHRPYSQRRVQIATSSLLNDEYYGCPANHIPNLNSSALPQFCSINSGHRDCEDNFHCLYSSSNQRYQCCKLTSGCPQGEPAEISSLTGKPVECVDHYQCGQDYGCAYSVRLHMDICCKGARPKGPLPEYYLEELEDPETELENDVIIHQLETKPVESERMETDNGLQIPESLAQWIIPSAPGRSPEPPGSMGVSPLAQPTPATPGFNRDFYIVDNSVEKPGPEDPWLHRLFNVDAAGNTLVVSRPNRDIPMGRLVVGSGGEPQRGGIAPVAVGQPPRGGPPPVSVLPPPVIQPAPTRPPPRILPPPVTFNGHEFPAPNQNRDLGAPFRTTMSPVNGNENFDPNPPHWQNGHRNEHGFGDGQFQMGESAEQGFHTSMEAKGPNFEGVASMSPAPKCLNWLPNCEQYAQAGICSTNRIIDYISCCESCSKLRNQTISIGVEELCIDRLHNCGNLQRTVAQFCEHPSWAYFAAANCYKTCYCREYSNDNIVGGF